MSYDNSKVSPSTTRTRVKMYGRRPKRSRSLSYKTLSCSMDLHFSTGSPNNVLCPSIVTFDQVIIAKGSIACFRLGSPSKRGTVPEHAGVCHMGAPQEESCASRFDVQACARAKPVIELWYVQAPAQRKAADIRMRHLRLPISRPSCPMARE